MKTKKVAASLPLMAGIILGAIGLTMPFLRADHYIYVDATTRNSVDNYQFFFWGKYYTVAGSKAVLSKMVLYDFGDFPVYAMAAIILALVLAAASIFAGRGLVMSVKGKELKLKLDINPIWFQIPAATLIALSLVYMNEGIKLLGLVLEQNLYVVETGVAIDFLLGSVASLVIATIMTATRFLKERKQAQQIKHVAQT